MYVRCERVKINFFFYLVFGIPISETIIMQMIFGTMLLYY